MKQIVVNKIYSNLDEAWDEVIKCNDNNIKFNLAGQERILKKETVEFILTGLRECWDSAEEFYRPHA